LKNISTQICIYSEVGNVIVNKDTEKETYNSYGSGCIRYDWKQIEKLDSPYQNYVKTSFLSIETSIGHLEKFIKLLLFVACSNWVKQWNSM